ncbi:deoxyribonuclease YjjV [Enterovibrio norvegicus FF-454]|uniref:Deoxyribonuclease YjjV n=1 Tax=Enterovibrio norvegicus FF-454 TaxID=1185651 RepID=A0A1E5C380_9GAMM|nr:TatD family hydrolase [Enterovibrio norvegicus]OEE59931.1 deoxyribonuclease YjjV [Enterovibrio norvegicus FF-454]
MIDTHCHFDFPPFDDETANWVSRTAAAGVHHLIVPSVAVSNWQTTANLANTFPTISFALGLHPVWLHEHHDDDIEKLDHALSLAPKACVAVGECGLDFAINNPQPEKQITLLRGQLALAEKHQLPVILHCRKAHNELLQILNEFPRVKGVLHAFSGSEQVGLNYVRRGFLLGIGGTITYERANKTRNAVKALPLSAMVLETDSPDMPVSGFQGEPNLPERLTLIVAALSELKGVSVEEIIHTTSQNANDCFALNT